MTSTWISHSYSFCWACSYGTCTLGNNVVCCKFTNSSPIHGIPLPAELNRLGTDGAYSDVEVLTYHWKTHARPPHLMDRHLQYFQEKLSLEKMPCLDKSSEIAVYKQIKKNTNHSQNFSVATCNGWDGEGSKQIIALFEELSDGIPFGWHP